jgi:predicted nucleic acid-binding protein
VPRKSYKNNGCPGFISLILAGLPGFFSLILAGLVPSLKVRNQQRIIKLLHDLKKLELSVNWHQIIEMQCKCMKSGLNGIGIPDLIIAQNARQNQCDVYTLDSQFELMKDILEFQLTD